MQTDPGSDASVNDAAYAVRAERKATNWIAIIRTADGTEIRFNVKDVSSSGARLGVPAQYDLPTTFMLKVVCRDFVCRVRTAWRKGDYVGVQIEQFGKITAPSPEASKVSARPSQLGTAPYSAIGLTRSKVRSF